MNYRYVEPLVWELKEFNENFHKSEHNFFYLICISLWAHEFVKWPSYVVLIVDVTPVLARDTGAGTKGVWRTNPPGRDDTSHRGPFWKCCRATPHWRRYWISAPNAHDGWDKSFWGWAPSSLFPGTSRPAPHNCMALPDDVPADIAD